LENYMTLKNIRPRKNKILIRFELNETNLWQRCDTSQRRDKDETKTWQR
jgi:hypothetical protein